MNQHNTTSDSVLGELSKTVEQFCSQFSLSNAIVPRFDSHNDVFTFITEYETATATLPEDQKKKLLVKSFPSGRLNAWYKEEIIPLVNTITWEAVKNKIIERFSDIEDRDRHVLRLESLKFNQDGSVKLYDYIEELVYSLSKAFPSLKDDDSKIRYIKAKLPSAIIPTLLTIPTFNTAKTIKELKEVFRLYDKLNAQRSNMDKSQSDTTKLTDLAQAIKGLVEVTLKQQRQTKDVVSALTPRSLSPAQPQHREIPERRYQSREASPGPSGYHRYQDRPNSPRYSRSPQRTPSPTRRVVDPNQYYYQNNNQNYNRNISYNRNQYENRQQDYRYYEPNNYQSSSRFVDQRSRNNYQNRSNYRASSPIPRNYGRNVDNRNYNSQEQQARPQNNEPSNFRQEEAFDLQAYYQKFGVPTSPCPKCHRMHWERHCHESLN